MIPGYGEEKCLSYTFKHSAGKMHRISHHEDAHNGLKPPDSFQSSLVPKYPKFPPHHPVTCYTCTMTPPQ